MIIQNFTHEREKIYCGFYASGQLCFIWCASIHKWISGSTSTRGTEVEPQVYIMVEIQGYIGHSQKWVLQLDGFHQPYPKAEKGRVHLNRYPRQITSFWEWKQHNSQTKPLNPSPHIHFFAGLHHGLSVGEKSQQWVDRMAANVKIIIWSD